jgi:hypothetical protein
MPQEFLNRSEICPSLKEMGGIGVSQGVRVR